MRTVYTLQGLIETLPQPARRSKTARRKAVADSRKALARFQGLLDYATEESPRHTVLALLWAKAHLDRALAMETQGVLGDSMATPSKYLRHLVPQEGAGIVDRGGKG